MLHSFTIGTPQNRPDVFLSDDRLRQLAPSIFADGAHESRSSRYQYIPTSRIITALRDEGFAPVKVQVARVRDDGRKGYEKHMIRFRRLDTAVAKTVGEVFPEAVMVNAHDGSTAWSLAAGLFRLVCSNGLVAPQGELGEVRIKHTGADVVRDVIEGTYRVLADSNVAIETASRWNQLQLSSEEQNALAVGAHHLRFADADGNVETPFQPSQLLRPRRVADAGSDLWSVFNRIQENVIKGGLTAIGVDANGRRRRSSTREVKGIDGNLNLNKALWKMAEALAAHKLN